MFAAQDDVTALQGSSSTQAGSIAAIQNDIATDVKVSIAQNDATLAAHSASITAIQNDIANDVKVSIAQNGATLDAHNASITALQLADQQADARVDQIAANVSQGLFSSVFGSIIMSARPLLFENSFFLGVVPKD
jgi:hypothetical protein